MLFYCIDCLIEQTEQLTHLSVFSSNFSLLSVVWTMSTKRLTDAAIELRGMHCAHFSETLFWESNQLLCYVRV